jgi:hypothetical protein
VMRESAQRFDRGDTHGREAGMRLFGCAPVFLIDEHRIGRGPRTLDDGLAAHLLRVHFDEIAAGSIHDQPLLSC